MSDSSSIYSPHLLGIQRKERRGSRVSDSSDGGSLPGRGHRYRWKSNGEYITNVLIYCSCIESIIRIANIRKYEFNIIQFIVTVCLLGMPLQYMQVSIGQYIQQSGTYLRNMCPIGNGIGYLFIMSTILRIIPISVFAGNILLYLLNMFQFELPWLNCEEKYKDICWHSAICEKDSCLNSTVHIASEIYYARSFMEIVTRDQKYLPDPRKLFATIFVWFLIYMALQRSSTQINKIIKILFYISLTIILVLNIALLSYTPQASYGLASILNLDLEDFVNIDVWRSCMEEVIMVMSISNGGHVLLGSYLETYTSPALITLFTAIAQICTFYLLLVLPHLSISSIVSNCKVSGPIPDYFYNEISFIAIPFSLGYSCLVAVITFMYFISSFLLSIAFVMLNTKILQISIEDENPKLIRYRKYVRFTFLLCCFLISLTLVIRGSKFVIESHFVSLFETLDICISLLFSLLVSWSYGVQRLCDDIHFNLGSQPSKYWKICWYLIPAVLGLCYFHHIMHMFRSSYQIYDFIIMHVLLLPTIILTLLEIFRHFKNRNLIGLFQPRERWGPPHTDERMLRRIFNPRMEIHSRRRHEDCYHPCLLDSKALKYIVKQEINFHRNAETL